MNSDMKMDAQIVGVGNAGRGRDRVNQSMRLHAVIQQGWRGTYILGLCELGGHDRESLGMQ